MSNIDTEMDEIMKEFLSKIENETNIYRKADMALEHMEGCFKAVKMFADTAQELLNNTDQEGKDYGNEIQKTVNDGQNKVISARSYISRFAPVERTSSYSDMDALLIPGLSGGSKKRKPTKKRHTKRRKSTKKTRKKRRTKRRR
tara:strand:- start:28 stop:459 length:432 start_codon:yes stop_codon:yes gene_type:complete